MAVAAHCVGLSAGCAAGTKGLAEHSSWSRRRAGRRYLCVDRVGQRSAVRARAADVEFGARDPFPEEIASNFADNVLGNSDTQHVILLPNSPALSLAQRSCVLPLAPGTASFSLDEARALRRKIIGWRLLEEQSGLKLECEWKTKDHEAGLELQSRILEATEKEGKPFELILEEQTHILRAKIWTETLGGVCENDFILAAKIDQVKTIDLLKKARFWA